MALPWPYLDTPCGHHLYAYLVTYMYLHCTYTSLSFIDLQLWSWMGHKVGRARDQHMSLHSHGELDTHLPHFAGSYAPEWDSTQTTGSTGKFFHYSFFPMKNCGHPVIILTPWERTWMTEYKMMSHMSQRRQWPTKKISGFHPKTTPTHSDISAPSTTDSVRGSNSPGKGIMTARNLPHLKQINKW